MEPELFQLKIGLDLRLLRHYFMEENQFNMAYIPQKAKGKRSAGFLCF